MNKKLMTGLLALALTGAVVYAAEPTIDYSLELKLTYTGVLYQSTDGENWTKVEGAASPYYVPVEDAKKMLFCSKDEGDQPGDSLIPGYNGTIPLSGTVNLDLNWIKPGTFMMGSPKGELGRFIDEAQHQVTLTRGYWMGKYEVTQAQYEAIMGKNPSHFKGADLPVEQVTWNNAMTFCAKLTEQERAAGRLPEGYEYTLPTESQWEYACRAGTVLALNNGKNLSNEEQCPAMDGVGWYVGNSDGMTHPVGQKQPNARGLYDMHGNVH
ncbi:MAG: formylglycine-generating enzyme family protein, partial [Verrucomicrobia bacterium]|nr:formylglycine-generating enzyme family protein [Verrucomicrobiota bacterium]